MGEERLAWQELLCEKDEAICEALDRQPILRRLRSKKKITQAKIDEINNPYTNQSDATRNGALMRFIEKSRDTETFEIFCQALKDSRQLYLAKMLEEGLVATKKAEDESGSSTGPSTTGQHKEEASGNEPVGHRLSSRGGDGKDADSGPSGPSALPAYPEALDGVRGNVLVINLRAYHNLQDRLGSPRDVADIKDTFEGLHYNVIGPHRDNRLDDPIAEMIPFLVEQFATNQQLHCHGELKLPAIVFVMGHGDYWPEKGGDVILDQVSRPVSVQAINERLCQLHDSPKLIFYQMCRGGEKTTSSGGHMKTEGSSGYAELPPAAQLEGRAKMDRNVQRHQSGLVPEGADLFIGQSTSPRKVALTSGSGSPYIASLCRQLREHGAGPHRLSLDAIMHKVHEEMQKGVWDVEEKGGTAKCSQVPLKTDSLKKQFFFGRP